MDANHQTISSVSPASTLLPSPAPGIWQAIGLITLYFALQLAVYGLIILSAGLANALQHGGDITHVLTMGHAWLAHSSGNAVAVMATLLIAAALTMRLAHRTWPSQWSMAQLPGFGFTAPQMPLLFFFGAVGLGVLTPVIGGILTTWLANGHQVSQDIKQLGSNIPVSLRLPLAILVVSVGPLVEELLFRGVLLSSIARYVGNGWAIVITAGVFACVHLPDLSFLWYALPNLALLGLVLGWLRVQSGSIWPAVLTHGVNNLMAVVSWFVLTSGS